MARARSSGQGSRGNKLILRSTAGRAIGAAGEGGDADEELVERAVRELRALVVSGQIDLAVKVGEYILKNFYGGSVEEAQAKRPVKGASLRRLTERAEEFGMSASGVRSAVPLSLQVRGMGVRLSRQLPVTHHLELLPLKDPAEKRLLAETAVAKGWTVRDLRRERGRLQKPHAGGRPSEPTVRVAVGRAARAILDEPSSAIELRRGLESVDAKEARGLLKKVEAMQRELERWEKLLVEAVGRAGED